MVEVAINQEGKFKIGAPFNSLMNENNIYKVVAIRSITEIIDSGHDVYGEAYELVGMSREEYEQDVKNNELIIVFNYNDSEYYYIPKRLIEEAPPINGRVFVEKALTVNLGSVYEGVDYSGLIPVVEDLIKAYTGLNVTGEIYETTGKIIVSETDYLTWLQKSKNNKEDICEVKYQRLLNQYNTLVAHKNKLEKIIEENC